MDLDIKKKYNIYGTIKLSSSSNIKRVYSLLVEIIILYIGLSITETCKSYFYLTFL